MSVENPVIPSSVTAVTGTVTANQGTASATENWRFNLAQWGGTAVAGGSGAATSGSPRVAIATDANAIKISDGTDTATVATALDSRNGLDIQHSSVASKQLVDQHSDDASHRLTAGSSKVLSPGGTRATYYDLDGYEGLYFAYTDNSPGASGGTMYFRWSRDGTNTAYNDPGDGTGGTNYDAISTADLVNAFFIPKKTRYVNFVFVQGAANQGSTYPQIAQMDITAYPNFFTSSVKIINPVNSPVAVGTSNPADGTAASSVAIAAVDGSSNQTPVTGTLAGANWASHVQGHQTVWTGLALVVAKKLQTSASPGATSVTIASSSTQVFGANTDRLGFSIYNESPLPVYIKRGTAASTTSYDWILYPHKQLVVSDPGYSGVIHHIAQAATGTLRCSEW